VGVGKQESTDFCTKAREIGDNINTVKRESWKELIDGIISGVEGVAKD